MANQTKPAESTVESMVESMVKGRMTGKDEGRQGERVGEDGRRGEAYTQFRLGTIAIGSYACLSTP